MHAGSERPTPWQVLEVEPGAGDSEIRSAYLAKVQEFPPDRAPEEFEQVRDAYESLKDPLRRAELMLEAAGLQAPVAAIMEGLRPTRRFIGPRRWLQLLREL